MMILHDRIMTASVAGSLVDCRVKPGNDGVESRGEYQIV
jgi:hypothetical protein